MDQLTVLGLDLGLTSAGCAKATGGALGGAPWLFRVQSKRRGVDRIDSQYRRIGEAVAECDPDLIVLEGPSLHSSGAYWHENAGLHWLVRHRIWQTGRPLAVVAPSTLKKFATGKGNADKVAMCVAATTRFGTTIDQPDQADALWLAAAGLERYGLPLVKLPAVQVAALDKADWPVSLDWARPEPVSA